MRATAVIEGQISGNTRPGFRHVGVGSQVDFFVFYTPPEPLDEDVVAPGSLAVHADLDLAARQDLDEIGRGELAALDALLRVKLRFGFG